jgi:hypothetical protein
MKTACCLLHKQLTEEQQTTDLFGDGRNSVAIGHRKSKFPYHTSDIFTQQIKVSVSSLRNIYL